MQLLNLQNFSFFILLFYFYFYILSFHFYNTVLAVGREHAIIIQSTSMEKSLRIPHGIIQHQNQLPQISPDMLHFTHQRELKLKIKLEMHKLINQ